MISFLWALNSGYARQGRISKVDDTLAIDTIESLAGQVNPKLFVGIDRHRFDSFPLAGGDEGRFPFRKTIGIGVVDLQPITREKEKFASPDGQASIESSHRLRIIMNGTRIGRVRGIERQASQLPPVEAIACVEPKLLMDRFPLQIKTLSRCRDKVASKFPRLTLALVPVDTFAYRPK